jgi:hypothetical protein
MYARQTTHELDAFVALHLCFDSIHSTLYRFTLPNFTESAKAEFLLCAPREWVGQVRFAACKRAKSVTAHLEHLVKHFPSHVPTSKLFNLYIFNSIQVQLQYYALQDSEQGEYLERESTAAGFQCMVELLGKMTTYFSDNRRLVSFFEPSFLALCEVAYAKQLRDTMKILVRHGYDVENEWIEQPESVLRLWTVCTIN